MSIKDLYTFVVKYTFILDQFHQPRQKKKKRALSCCFEQAVQKGLAALSHLSSFFHLAWGSVVLTVWRLKHPLSFPAPVVAFPKRVQIWIVFSTPFGADYREPAFQWPSRFMVVSGTSYQRGGIGGVQISCALYLCKPLFQPNTKGEAWLNPFYFLVCFLCVCAHSRVHVSPSTRMCRLCFYVHRPIGTSLNAAAGIFGPSIYSSP